MPAQDNEEKHIKKLTPKDSHEVGCVTKHITDFKKDRCAYRGNGYVEMKGGHTDLYHIDFTLKKNWVRLPFIYKEFKLGTKDKKDPSNWRFAVDPILNKQAWWFTSPANFTIAYLPYNHNYHHILPFEALKQLTYEELDWLQATTYNLNAGNNMIILPCLDAYGIAMMLPAHPYNHPEYTNAVKSIVNEIKQDVKTSQRGHKMKKDDLPNFKTKLENWQGRQFKALVRYGKSLVKTEDVEKGSDPNQVNNAPIASALSG